MRLVLKSRALTIHFLDFKQMKIGATASNEKLVRYSTFDIRYSNGEVSSIFDIRYSNGEVSSIFDIQMEKLVRHSIFDIQMEKLVRYSTFDIRYSNREVSTIFDIRTADVDHLIRVKSLLWHSDRYRISSF